MTDGSEDKISYFCETDQDHKVYRVYYLQNYHYYAACWRTWVHTHVDANYEGSSQQWYKHIVFCVPFFAGHLLQQDIIMRVIDLELLPVADNSHSHQHQKYHNQCQYCYWKGEGLEIYDVVNWRNLGETWEEKNVVDECDESDWKDDFFSFK